MSAELCDDPLVWRVYLLGGIDPSSGRVLYKIGTTKKDSRHALKEKIRMGYGGVEWRRDLYFGNTPVRQQFDQAVLDLTRPVRVSHGSEVGDLVFDSWREANRTTGYSDATEIMTSEFQFGHLFKETTFKGEMHKKFGYKNNLEFKQQLNAVFVDYKKFGFRKVLAFKRAPG